jgi:hypothetical protein
MGRGIGPALLALARGNRNLGNRDPLFSIIDLGGLTVKLATAALTCMIVLSGPFALAHGQRHHHHWRHSASHCPGGPNGTAGGPTTLSGTGPSTYGGNIPGARGCAKL